jgi:hypothetical protein
MPDTGAPWNIPFAAPADLVRDWPDLSEEASPTLSRQDCPQQDRSSTKSAPHSISLRALLRPLI